MSFDGSKRPSHIDWSHCPTTPASATRHGPTLTAHRRAVGCLVYCTWLTVLLSAGGTKNDVADGPCVQIHQLWPSVPDPRGLFHQTGKKVVLTRRINPCCCLAACQAVECKQQQQSSTATQDPALILTVCILSTVLPEVCCPFSLFISIVSPLFTASFSFLPSAVGDPPPPQLSIFGLCPL